MSARQSEAEMSQRQKQVGRRRMSLFVRQVEKEAQQRLSDLEAKVENVLDTIDKAFKVEMMKMPASLLSTRMGDLVSEEEFFSGEVRVSPKKASPRESQSLRRVPSRRVKSRATPDCSAPERPSAKTSRAGRAAKLPRSLASRASAGDLGSSSVATKRSQSRAAKTAEPSKPRLRLVASTGDLPCSMAASAAHITVTTGRGQTISFSEETKHDVNLDLLDEVAWCQIQRLTSLMAFLSRRSRSQR